jgi:transcriptional regulator with GAF, ATPase, and Fis domain
VRELDRARAYDWPGNIRELQNAVERAVILARGGTLELPLPAGAPQQVTPRESPSEPEEIIPEHRWHDLERANVMRALRQSEFRLYGSHGAAERLGVNPATLASRLKRLGINATDLKRSQHGQQRKA